MNRGILASGKFGGPEKEQAGNSGFRGRSKREIERFGGGASGKLSVPGTEQATGNSASRPGPEYTPAPVHGLPLLRREIGVGRDRLHSSIGDASLLELPVLNTKVVFGGGPDFVFSVYLTLATICLEIKF